MKNLSLAILALLITGVAISLYSPQKEKSMLEEYTIYAEKYNKVVESSEETFYRAFIFNIFLEKMEKHNSDSEKSWKMGINEFSDLTDE